MKLAKKVSGLSALVSLLASAALAIPLGDNITINDGSWASSANATYNLWWNHPETPGEDQEVEPNCIPGQNWDLEGFFLDGLDLVTVGGWDFKSGVYGYTYTSGDIFIDTDGNLANGYSYVYDLDFATESYSVYGGDFTVLGVSLSQNVLSNPWRRNAGGTLLGTGTMNYWSGLNDADVAGLLGGAGEHYAAGVSLAMLNLPSGSDFVSHFTMQCGNDNLMGHGKVPDGGMTVALLGFAVLGVESLRRMLKR